MLTNNNSVSTAFKSTFVVKARKGPHRRKNTSAFYSDYGYNRISNYVNQIKGGYTVSPVSEKRVQMLPLLRKMYPNFSRKYDLPYKIVSVPDEGNYDTLVRTYCFANNLTGDRLGPYILEN